MEAMETLVWVSLNAAAIAIRVAWVAAPICFGTWIILFRRKVSIDSLQQRRRVWKMGFSDFDVRVGEIAAAAMGTFFLIFGLIQVAELVLP